MLKKFKITLGAALIAASQLAVADTAEVKLSNVSMFAWGDANGLGGNWAWYWLPDGDAARATAALENPSFAQSVVGAPATALLASVTDGSAVATADLKARTGSWGLEGVQASALVNASNGQVGSADVMLIERSILVAGTATVEGQAYSRGITITANLDSFLASGPMSQANVYMDICYLGECSSAEAFVDGTYAYTGPSLLSVTWTNPYATNTWVDVRFGVSASVTSVAAPVPEPSTYALWLGGLAAVGAIARRRRRD